MKSDPCSNCDSTKIIRNTRIIDVGESYTKNDLSVEIKTTNNTFFNKFEKGKLNAHICGSCGKVDLSIDNPQALWEAYLKSKNL